MGKHLKISLMILISVITIMVSWDYYQKGNANKADFNGSDSSTLKATIRVAVDGWIGYFPLCSPYFLKSIRQEGYRVDCIDDNADYANRYRHLAKGKYDFAMGTLDAYLVNAQQNNFPGQIIAVTDQSKGGDALVVDKSIASSLDDLKDNAQLQIAYTPNSPSEHLLRFLAVDFGIDDFIESRHWSVESDGSADALLKLQSGAVNAAVLWEPDVSKALKNNNTIKLFDSAKVNGLIVDILIASNEVAQDSELTTLFLHHYFQALQYYGANKSTFIQHVSQHYAIKPDTATTLIQGVKWFNLTDNVQVWMPSSGGADKIIQSINATISILQSSQVFKDNPLPQRDPYALVSSQFIKQLASRGTLIPQSINSLKSKQVAISSHQWQQLTTVGTFKTQAIQFSASNSVLTDDDRSIIKQLKNKLDHYPLFFIEVQGHTSTRGDKTANQTLSTARAESVVEQLIKAGISSNQIRAVGYGGSQPLSRDPNESLRTYNYRLPRVEVLLKASQL